MISVFKLMSFIYFLLLFLISLSFKAMIVLLFDYYPAWIAQLVGCRTSDGEVVVSKLLVVLSCTAPPQPFKLVRILQCPFNHVKSQKFHSSFVVHCKNCTLQFRVFSASCDNFRKQIYDNDRMLIKPYIVNFIVTSRQ